MTIKELLDLVEPMRSLSKVKFNEGGKGYKVAKAVIKIDDALKPFNAMVEAYKNENPVPEDEKGKAKWVRDIDAYLDTVVNETVEIELPKLGLTEDDLSDVSVDTIVQLMRVGLID